jgi:hypothetical protein
VGSLTIGARNFGAGTPYALSVSQGGLYAGTTLTAWVLGSATFTSNTILSSANLVVEAGNSITISSGSLASDDGSLSLLADQNSVTDGLVSISGSSRVAAGSGLLTITAWDVTVAASSTATGTAGVDITNLNGS